MFCSPTTSLQRALCAGCEQGEMVGIWTPGFGLKIECELAFYGISPKGVTVSMGYNSRFNSHHLTVECDINGTTSFMTPYGHNWYQG